ncbi:MAG: hypothetical protein AAB658_19100 [Chloroflexota bacterium]
MSTLTSSPDTLTLDTLPTPPVWLEYTWRPLRPEDVPALFNMLLAIGQADDRL